MLLSPRNVALLMLRASAGNCCSPGASLGADSGRHHLTPISIATKGKNLARRWRASRSFRRAAVLPQVEILRPAGAGLRMTMGRASQMRRHTRVSCRVAVRRLPHGRRSISIVRRSGGWHGLSALGRIRPRHPCSREARFLAGARNDPIGRATCFFELNAMASTPHQTLRNPDATCSIRDCYRQGRDS
jgi:hypothetical protein